MSARLHECVGALLVREGRVLLGRRCPQREFLAGSWDVIGGHVEAGESCEQALARELGEELDVVPTRWQALDCPEGTEPEPWRLQLYAVTAWRGEPRNARPDEHDELRWCALDEAVAHLGPAHPGFAAALARALAIGAG
ncbi:NUDIX domain-containing protein [Lysobacter silvisoli]|uniref:8-oxo-dGTP diphosphatase n=1 Tax=Lysobacter silvisoli TaxID=2293254 RepID=A0A371JZW4_9GAMM|nr:NUDIX domain-containing protein [Lysobacter silvisoli]RDZ27184.1 NUDIX domain-containing protein [Lysobacter silvisoli]